MELTLNLVWLCVAVACYALLGRRLWQAGGRPICGLAPWQCVVTLTCALVILFPVISLTDDLNDQNLVLEESRPLRGATRIGPQASDSAHQDGTHLWLAAFALLSTRSVARLVVGRVQEFFASIPESRDSRPSIGRAPPLSPA